MIKYCIMTFFLLPYYYNDNYRSYISERNVKECKRYQRIHKYF